MSQQLTCIDCGNEFEFTDGEEKFYQEKGLFPPKRCKKCRLAKRREKGDGMSSHRPSTRPHSYPRY